MMTQIVKSVNETTNETVTHWLTVEVIVVALLFDVLRNPKVSLLTVGLANLDDRTLEPRVKAPR